MYKINELSYSIIYKIKEDYVMKCLSNIQKDFISNLRLLARAFNQ